MFVSSHLPQYIDQQALLQMRDAEELEGGEMMSSLLWISFNSIMAGLCKRVLKSRSYFCLFLFLLLQLTWVCQVLREWLQSWHVQVCGPKQPNV